MCPFRGADKIIVGKAHGLGQIAEGLADLIGEGLGIHALLFRRLRDLLPMLIRAS